MPAPVTQHDRTPRAVSSAPYDKVKMQRKVPRYRRGKVIGLTTRPVAPYLDLAIERGHDYYHPGADEHGMGGEIYDSKGQYMGRRVEAGWFVYGMHWEDDRPQQWAKFGFDPDAEPDDPPLEFANPGEYHEWYNGLLARRQREVEEFLAKGTV